MSSSIPSGYKRPKHFPYYIGLQAFYKKLPFEDVDGKALCFDKLCFVTSHFDCTRIDFTIYSSISEEEWNLFFDACEAAGFTTLIGTLYNGRLPSTELVTKWKKDRGYSVDIKPIKSTRYRDASNLSLLTIITNGPHVGYID